MNSYILNQVSFFGSSLIRAAEPAQGPYAARKFLETHPTSHKNCII